VFVAARAPPVASLSAAVARMEQTQVGRPMPSTPNVPEQGVGLDAVVGCRGDGYARSGADARTQPREEASFGVAVSDGLMFARATSTRSRSSGWSPSSSCSVSDISGH
jgi:hypothetical protein